tara:strand:- start:113 stop:589 length:477 start_codon:yes stop_codon:yes gene_type:complete
MKYVSKSKDEIKKVSKPWGYELWIASDENDAKFAMKEIFIKSGYKTSYQFHEKKEESNYILSGSGKLFISEKKINLSKFKNNEYTDIELKNIISNLKEFNLSKGSSFYVKPLYVHSVLSTNNLLMMESSTLHLDDVYRIFDESGRSHGRINSEHNDVT